MTTRKRETKAKTKGTADTEPPTASGLEEALERLEETIDALPAPQASPTVDELVAQLAAAIVRDEPDNEQRALALRKIESGHLALVRARSWAADAKEG